MGSDHLSEESKDGETRTCHRLVEQVRLCVEPNSGPWK